MHSGPKVGYSTRLHSVNRLLILVNLKRAGFHLGPSTFLFYRRFRYICRSFTEVISGVFMSPGFGKMT